MATRSQNRVQFLRDRGKEFAKDLTVKATRWELEFKAKLDSYGISYVFQYPIVCNKKYLYILDFYLPNCKLAIELDGQAHYTSVGIKKDKLRTRHINREGIQVLRFGNALVAVVTEKNLKSVLSQYCKNQK